MNEDGDLRALHAISSLALAIDDPGEAARAILGEIAKALPCDSGLIAFQNPETGRLEIEADIGLPPGAERSLVPGQGISGWVVWHARALAISDSEADPRSRPTRPLTRSEAAAPMRVDEGHVIGVVELASNTAGAFSQGDAERLARLATAAYQSLRRLWELRHLRGKARQLEALIAAGQALVGKLEQREIFETLARDATAMLQAHACAFFLHEPQRGTLRLAAYTGDPEALDPEADLPLRACLSASAVHTRRPVAFADVRSAGYNGLGDLPHDDTVRSALVAPMLFEGEVLGVLAVFTDKARVFDNDEKRLCAALCGVGAVALQNSRLYARVFMSEESLRKNERLTTLGLLAAEIAHEIRNPLTVLKLLNGGLGLDFPEGDPRRTDVRVISEKLDQLEAIVTRVLSFAKAPTSLHARHQMSEIVSDTLVLVRLKLAQSKVRVHFEPPAQPIVVEAHKGQLQQVLLNLLINSLQAMPAGGEITLRLSLETRGLAPWAVLDVQDSGSGIPDVMRGRIFDSFLSGRPDGTGLGLAIAKRVLLGHNGDIQLVSSSPAGTTMRVVLPAARA